MLKKIHEVTKWSNLHERSGIGWIERKTKFPIFIFRVMPKNNVAGNSGMPLSANLLKLGSSILPRAKRATNRRKQRSYRKTKQTFFFSFFFLNGSICCQKSAAIFRTQYQFQVSIIIKCLNHLFKWGKCN